MSKAVEDFVKSLQVYLPNLRLTSSGSYYTGEEPLSATVDLRFSNGIMTAEQHCISPDTLLIHYTSLPVLFEMIKSGRFRLYRADKQNDPQELVHIIDDIPDLNLDELKKERESLYIGSFCAYSEKNKDESFPMWRLYGQNGSGVAIVFKLVNESTERWIDYNLGKVAYKRGDETTATLRELFKLAHAFQQREDYKIENIPYALYAYALLNKTEIWEEEKEIRLMHYNKIDFLRWLHDDPREFLEQSDVYPSVTANGDIRYFTELRLDIEQFLKEVRKLFPDEDHQKAAFNFKPLLKIEKVILGYNFSIKKVYNLEVNLRRLAKTSLGYSFPVCNSKLSKFFNSSE